MSGLDAALELGADFIVNTDADNQYSATYIPQLIAPLLEKRADIVIGARTIETIERSEKPVAITHANARSFCDHPRNKTDDALKLLAERGGVIGACAFTSFLPQKSASTVDDFVDSIDDLVQRIGIDQVGVGTDATQDQELPFWHYIAGQQGTKFPSTFSDPSMRYTEETFQPKGMDTPAEWPNLTAALLQRGYSSGDTKKLLGGNWMRLFEEVWPG